MKFRDRIARFMYGRYGTDELYRFLFIAFYVVFILNLFIRSIILSALSLAILIWATYRSFSKNIYGRRAENAKYLKIKNSFVNFFKLQKNKWRDRKTHVYRKCPTCGAVLRLPKKKGIHTARCPGCSNNFEVKV
ncbi:MAG: hypothetical protein IJZ89_09185 [Clostridia bacterium]|nr:hypothetical protein [Clostridia bacterium]